MTGATRGLGPIGVFDSGVGGLTVLRALREAMPEDDFIYLGDTARLPYGTKSPQSVVRYSLQCAEALVIRGIGCLVVACNTASAFALDALRRRHPDIPVFGVIEPGAAAAVAVSRSRHIVVIGTEGTVGAGAYQSAIHRLRADIQVTATACSLFVALAEEGWTRGVIAEAVARRYLEPIFLPGQTPAPDTLVLGCTHFPALAAAIRGVLPDHVALVDSAATVAATVTREITRRTACAAPAAGAGGGRGRREPRGKVTWLATDGAQRFARVSGIFLGRPLSSADVEVIDL